MSSQQSESGIPVLTEIIATPVYGVDLPERRTSPPAAASIAVASAESRSDPALDSNAPRMPDGLDEATLDRIRHEVAACVLQQLMSRVDFVLEQRIRDSLADVLQTAVDGLACQLRFGLKETLEDVLARAVNQEIQKLPIPK